MYYIYYYKEEPIETVIQDTIEVKEDTIISNDIYVEIKGAVASPGVYKLTDTNIINDLIEDAGGFTEYAYTKNINLSRKLSDQMVIYVYTTWEYNNLNKQEIVYVETKCSCPSYDISSCTSNGESVIEDGPSTYSDDSKSTLVNINTASKEELMTLSGIGEAKAENIIKYRETNGNFKTTEEIVNVSGISENIYEKIKDSITV